MSECWNFIIGGGDFASAMAIELFQSRQPVVIVVPENPMDLRWPLSFSEAVYYGKKTIAETTALLVAPNENAPIDIEKTESYSDFLLKSIEYLQQNRSIPLITMSDFKKLQLTPDAKLVVRTLPENEFSMDLSDADTIFGLLPLHQPGTHCHIAIEARLTANIGRAWHAPAEMPIEKQRVMIEDVFEAIAAPLEGAFTGYKSIGERIHKNESIGTINGIDITSSYDGQIWGILHSGKIIQAKQQMVLINTRYKRNEYQSFGFDHKIVAGAVLREILKVSGQ